MIQEENEKKYEDDYKKYIAKRNKNETMKMLGKQTCEALLEVASKDFKNVMDAYTEDEPNINGLYIYGLGDIYNLSMDVFNLGFIYGKRAERARRRKQANNRR